MPEGLWLGAGGFAVDSRALPLVVVSYPEQVKLVHYQQLFAHYAELCEKHRRIAWLIEFRAFDPVTAPAAVRRQCADVFAKHRERLRRSTVCEARVVESTLSRGVLTAFDWLTGAKWPARNFARYSEAATWIAAELGAGGVRARPKFPSFHQI